MRRVERVEPAGAWPRGSARATVTLPYDDRHRRRVRLVADDGCEFLLDLPEAIVLRDGDGLCLDDGAWLAVRAADEQVCDIACPTPEALARIAWHLGNRHLPVQILERGLRIRDDHVIVTMLEGMGAAVTRRTASFDPEGGAYARTHGHAHGAHAHQPHD
ncbi:MAG TPA: urease accessory protein UreE [Alphaproteobacteria bacterium]|nr:urease accessory protein UreE [Alphaproteobacteria bacterium]